MNAPVVGIVLPIAEVFDEASGIVGAAGDLGAGTQMGEIQIDAGPQFGDLFALNSCGMRTAPSR